MLKLRLFEWRMLTHRKVNRWHQDIISVTTYAEWILIPSLYQSFRNPIQMLGVVKLIKQNTLAASFHERLQ